MLALLRLFDTDRSGGLDETEFEAFARSLCDIQGAYTHQLLRHVAVAVVGLPLLAFSIKVYRGV